MRTRSLTLITILLTALSACGWTQPGFDSGHSRANGFETALTTTNVGGLEEHTVSLTGIQRFFVVRGWIIVNTASGATSYDRKTCPRSDNGPCTPVWTRAGQPLMSSDGRSTMFFATGAGTFDAVDFGGTTLWSGTAVDPTGISTSFWGENAFTISGDRLLVTREVGIGHGSYAATMNVFPTAGCGRPACVPERNFPFRASFFHGPHWSAVGDTLVAWDTGSVITAQSLATGATLWTANADPFETEIRGGLAYVHADTPSILVFDAAGQTGCSGLPRSCIPLRTLLSPAILAVSDTIAVGAKSLPENATGLSFFGTSGAGCSGSPVTCQPVATTPSVANTGRLLTALTPNLVFAVGSTGSFFTQTTHLYAFDAGTSTGCSGSPKVCQPLFDVVVPNGANGLEVWDGRVYISAPDGLHVFSLPGDVS